MKNKILFFSFIIFFVFIFFIFYKGLDNSNIYKPKNIIEDIPDFKVKTFFQKKNLSTKDIFDENEFYLFNIWASWCVPCKDEHQFLMNLSKNDKIKIIGLNYKDNFYSAEKFINSLGNPYSEILLDKDGTIAIEWGAFGVPETFLIRNNKIIKRHIGPIDLEFIENIKDFIK